MKPDKSTILDEIEILESIRKEGMLTAKQSARLRKLRGMLKQHAQ